MKKRGLGIGIECLDEVIAIINDETQKYWFSIPKKNKKRKKKTLINLNSFAELKQIYYLNYLKRKLKLRSSF